jgi:hypothetical protein
MLLIKPCFFSTAAQHEENDNDEIEMSNSSVSQMRGSESQQYFKAGKKNIKSINE